AAEEGGALTAKCVAGAATLVRLKVAWGAPLAAALTAKLPETVLAVADTLAWPEALIVAVLPGENVALAPLAGAVKATTPPWTGSPNALLTVTASGVPKGLPTTALWLLPPATSIVKPRDSNAPMSAVPLTRMTPRWSLAGALALSPASMAGLPGSRGIVW